MFPLQVVKFGSVIEQDLLTLKAPITTLADDEFCNIFPNFQKIQRMILHKNRLTAEDSHEIPYLIYYF